MVPSNNEIADALAEIASLLDALSESPHRVRAYRNAATTVRMHPNSIAQIAQEKGRDGLEDIGYIGRGLAAVIAEYVERGRSHLLDDLRRQVTPVELLKQVPGLGPELAHRVVEELDVTSLEQLELAAHDGRLDSVKGFGPNRVETVRTSLAGLLSGAAERRGPQDPTERSDPTKNPPPVELLLAIDRSYREKAKAGKLRRIAPRRFNPSGEAWLPIMHEKRNGWKFTALFSNTARAHKLGETHDWVVIYYRRNGREEQATVVTATKGALKSKRVVRGREAECEIYYKQEPGTG